MIRKPFTRTRLTQSPGGESKTKQSFKNECDINNILKKYKKTGLLEHVSQYQGNYDDVSGSIDYQTALTIVLQAQNTFDSLPSDIRKRFANNPQYFFEFVTDPNNIDEMCKLGLAKKRVIPGETTSTAPAVDVVEPETPKA